ncbi:YdcF family protein [Kribbella deserti]|uniref:YdcF family protein n=1 Tax=Kribbella deserti TaxID=1926257 RepID=A0ABV6QE10_9ACTN
MRLSRGDVLVLLGSAVLASIVITADAYHRGITRHLLISGGIGHSTGHLHHAVRRHYPAIATTGRPEAHVIADILHQEYAVPPEAIAVEDRSTNCGENATYSRRITAGHGHPLVRPPGASVGARSKGEAAGGRVDVAGVGVGAEDLAAGDAGDLEG